MVRKEEEIRLEESYIEQAKLKVLTRNYDEAIVDLNKVKLHLVKEAENEKLKIQQ